MTDRSRAVLGDGARMNTKTFTRVDGFPEGNMGIYRGAATE
jgi:hypothetical protein